MPKILLILFAFCSGLYVSSGFILFFLLLSLKTTHSALALPLAQIPKDVHVSSGLILLSLGLYRYIIRPTLLSPLARVPKAHWSCSVSPFWILWARYKSRENRTLYEAHRQHGPIVRVGPSELSVNSIEAVKTIYQGGFDKHQCVPCMFSSVQSKRHSLRKRMVSNVYSKSYLHGSKSQAAQSEVILNAKLMPLLKTSTAESQRPHGLNVHSLFCAVAMDFISAYCFGVSRFANFIEKKAYRDHWLTLYSTRKGYGFFNQELPGLSKVLGFLGVRLTPEWVDDANHELEAWCKKHSDASIQDLQRARKSSINSADDPVVVRALLSGLEKEHEANESESPVSFQPQLPVASEIIDHVLAGQETTGVALTYLSYHLSQSIELQRELRTELLTLEPNMKLRDGSVTIPDPKQLDNLPILHAMIMETVRRYAPAGGPEPRITPSPSCRVGSFEVPGGTRVSASPYVLHRDTSSFPNPEKWDHTRWLAGNSDDAAINDINKQFWGFSSGGRMCLGSNFAMHDMKLTIAAIYSNYTSHIVNDDGIEPTDAYTGRPKSNSLYVRFEEVH
ncbi:cytochrome P450 [Xylariaceae sp. FL0804]|nr:cytochrome P450 [Xylariaceae sp. FL0804]